MLKKKVKILVQKKKLDEQGNFEIVSDESGANVLGGKLAACPSLTNCGIYNGDCANLTNCGTYDQPPPPKGGGGTNT